MIISLPCPKKELEIRTADKRKALHARRTKTGTRKKSVASQNACLCPILFGSMSKMLIRDGDPVWGLNIERHGSPFCSPAKKVNIIGYAEETEAGLPAELSRLWHRCHCSAETPARTHQSFLRFALWLDLCFCTGFLWCFFCPLALEAFGSAFAFSAFSLGQSCGFLQ